MRHVRTAVERWPLATPFRISRGTKTAADVVTVEIVDGAATGRGECVPYPRYGESPQSVLAQIEAVSSAVAAGMSRTELASFLPPGAARNAVDCALWDLEASLSRRTVEQVLGRPLAPFVTALTIGLDSPRKMAAAATALAGTDLIKVKVNADDPEACLKAVREAAPGARLIVDPNESWNLTLLEKIQPLLCDLRVDFVEQPLPSDGDASLEKFEPLVPICADESCHSVDDLDSLRRRYQIVNIKLDKSGGLTSGLELLEAARGHRFRVMVGCMISTSLSIAPAMHIAARADYVDLDGPLWLRGDRPGGVTLHGGLLRPPAPGFWG